MFFITGADAFAEIATWHDYPRILDLAHFVVIARPGQPMEELSSRLPDLAPRMRLAGDRPAPAAGPEDSCAIVLVRAHTPDVSSTEIRALARAGASLAGLVPPGVERHIRRHALYAD